MLRKQFSIDLRTFERVFLVQRMMIFMVLPSRIHCKTQVKTLLVVTLSLGKQLEPFGNSLHTPFYMKYQPKTENVQFWLTPREESEGTL